MYVRPVRPVYPSFAPPVTQLYSEEIHTMSFRFDVSCRRENRMMRALAIFALALVALLPAARASAQSNTGAIRGYVRGSDGQPIPDATITAVDSTTNITRNTLSNAEGIYSLNGLQPARYTVSARRIGFNPVSLSIQVQVGQTLTHDFSLTAGAQQLAVVTVTGANPVDTRSTEASTNVTQAQISQLPTSSRNILDLAELAPGVHVTPDRIDGTDKEFSAGAQPAEAVNLIVDGQSYKNDIITGGIAGQDASRGNPFPRNAVQEFRVITNNYKAEYQKASSAIIAAVTKSGGNSWEGSTFLDYQNKSLVSLDTFAAHQHAVDPNFVKPDYSRYLFGASAGGPIIKDKLFFFGTYEGNFQNREGTVTLGTPAFIPPAIAGFDISSHQSPFRENLGFAKLTYNMSDKQLLELTGNLRKESDTRDFGGFAGGSPTTFSAADDQISNVYSAALKHTYYGSKWTNEAMVSYQDYLWNTNPLNFDEPGLQYNNIGRFGGASTYQNLTQKRLSLRNDFTYTGFNWKGAHVLKFGVNDDVDKYDFNKQLNSNPVYTFDAVNSFQDPIQAQLGIGNGVLNQNNNQFGVYAQDDWSPTSRLTFNVGVRWDVESGMFNRNYVTPQNVRDSLTEFRDSLFIDVNPAQYFTNGTDRHLFLGAFQPRFGVSYALDEAAKTTVFASVGKFYDRLNYNATTDETYKRQFHSYTFNFSDTAVTDPNSHLIQWQPQYATKAGLEALASGGGGQQETYLVPNDLKPPHTNQWSAGVRHNFGSFNGSVSYDGARGYNGYSNEWANLTYNPATNDCCLSANVPAYQNVLVGNNTVHTWYKAMYLSLDRPYQREVLSNWGWGAGVAYTLSKSEQEGNDLFSFPAVLLGANARHPTNNDQRHQIVANFVSDLPFAWGIQFSGFATIGSGLPYQVVEFVRTPDNGQLQTFLGQNRSPWQKEIDFRFRKNFLKLMGNSVGVTASVFNAFNTQNFGCYDGNQGSPGATVGSIIPNANFGNPGCVVTDPRRYQFGVQYDFK
jgi:hypothetical protein